MLNSKHKYLRIISAHYLILYFCLIIPWHLNAHSHMDFSSETSWSESSDEHDTHDPRSCQVCLTSGQVPALYSEYSFIPLIDINVEPAVEVAFLLDSAIIDHDSSRAPPLTV